MTASPALARAPQLRREALRDALLASVDMLGRNRAAEIPDGFIDDYVALAWLRWRGGSLELTHSGATLCAQLRAHLE